MFENGVVLEVTQTTIVREGHKLEFENGVVLEVTQTGRTAEYTRIMFENGVVLEVTQTVTGDKQQFLTV